jgi:hypothetical protein
LTHSQLSQNFFQRSRIDKEVLAELLAELSQRSTIRAGRLRASVLEVIEAAQKSRAPELSTPEMQAEGELKREAML